MEQSDLDDRYSDGWSDGWHEAWSEAQQEIELLELRILELTHDEAL